MKRHIQVLARDTRPASVRRGLTLIELLVVISILMLLAAMAIPAVRPALEGRRIREAARAVNVYLSSAQGEAMRTGRPCGVILQRVEGLPQCSMVLQQAIVPPPYAGDTMGAAVRIRAHRRDRGFFAEMVGGFNPRLVHVGDRMQINGQGPWYLILGPDDGTGLIDQSVVNKKTPLRLACEQNNVPWTTEPSAPLPYRILRRPIKSSAKPLQLPAGAVVDLVASGTDAQQFGWNGSWAPGDDTYEQAHAPVMIMFSPNGSVERIIYERYSVRGGFSGMADSGGRFLPRSELAIRPIHLLIGKRERVTGQPPPAGSTEEDFPNWADPENLWVSINPQTGLVSTAENAYIDPQTVAGLDWRKWDNVWPMILEARTFARESKSMGGR